MNRKIYRHKPTGELFRQTNTLEIRGMEDIESDGLILPIWLVEQSDDWEEVKEEGINVKKIIVELDKKHVPNLMKEEPNYLITAFRDLRGGYATDIWKITSEGKYCKNEYAPVSLNHMINTGECVNNGKFEIYSVKNSKGEEFTIGDEIVHFNTHPNGKFKIGQFFIRKDTNEVLVRENDSHGARNEFLEYIIKTKAPIHTTTDGFDIYEGDKPTLYLLESNLTFKDIHTVPIFRGFYTQDKEVADRYLTFTSEENRDKYIKDNTKKPVFVSADNVTFYDNNTDYSLFSVLPKANWQENRYRLNDIIKWPKKEWLHFHTKEARQEYIDNNKPKYSLADVFMASEKIPSGHLITTGMLDQLKKLGK